MEITQSYALMLTLALGYEYSLKQWWADFIGRKTKNPIRNYVLYRLTHLVLLAGSGFWFFPGVHGVPWLAFSVCLVLLGSLELLVGLIILRIKKATGASLYQLNYLVPLSLFLVSYLMDYPPRFDLDYRLILMFALLGHSANYFIRWALNKSEGFPEELFDRNQPSSMEAAATADPLQHLGDNERIGRRIGTIERLLILLLVISKNLSSLGLVITAKSIVRYPQLSNKAFAEYYLFGTLLSVVIALASAFFVLGGL